jgi:hypothetical protein
MSQVMADNKEKIPFKQFTKQTFNDAGRALLLQNDMYQPYLEKERPFRFGCGALALLMLPAAIALGIGVALSLATLPRADMLQEQFNSLLTQSAIYQSLATQYPTLEIMFNLIYSLSWLFIRLSGIYPYPASILLTPISFITGVLFTWWLFAILIQMVAGWLGGKTSKGAMYGPMVFAFAPQLLNTLGFIPGLTVPLPLITAWTLAITYQILRAVFGFSWGRAVATILLTLVMHIVLIILSVIFGVLIGVAVAGAMS